jgi:hypothetical protein
MLSHQSDTWRALLIERRARAILQAGPQAHTRVLAPVRPIAHSKPVKGNSP